MNKWQMLSLISGLSLVQGGLLFAQGPATQPNRDIEVMDSEGGQSNAHIVSVPSTVSAQIRPLVATTLGQWNVHPDSVAEWQQFRASFETPTLAELPGIRSELGVTLEHAVIGGVKVSILTPRVVAPENAQRVFLNFHGGGYVLNSGEAGTREATYMAAFGRAKVISVDYRLAPENPYPAALDDGMAVYRGLIAQYLPDRIGVFGTSSGGALTLALVLRAKAQGLPLPGAIAPGSPWSDMTKTGDTYMTLEFIDNFQVSYDGWLRDAAVVYANGEDMKNPLLSPVYADLGGLPPAILTSGTRDLFLSNTVRVHRKLREAGVIAELQVFEGLSHNEYAMVPTAPETKEAFAEIARFFDRHLAR
jgi:monoterpene epsilon-lactone hydrolase